MFGLLSSQRRPPLKTCGLLHPRKMLHLPHVVGNIVGDALVDLEDFVALAPFLRRACPSFAKAEWQLAAATSTRNQTRRARFIMMIIVIAKGMNLFYNGIDWKRHNNSSLSDSKLATLNSRFLLISSPKKKRCFPSVQLITVKLG
jgi:hypothetical protein